MSATILEIARRLNLSHSTVSRVLNGKRNTPIAEDTRRRVLTAAREMGYRPNLAARSMRDARSNLVALFASPHVGIWGGITPDIVRVIAPLLHQKQLDLFFAFAVETDSGHLSGLPAWRYDAAIVFQFPPEETIEHLRLSRRPCITVNECIEGFSGVLSDEDEGIRLAISHLYDQGHRRIAYANASGGYHFPHYSVAERHAAYVKVMQEYGLTPMIGHEDRPSNDDRSRFLRRVFVEERATAVVAYDHVVAMDILGAADALRIRIPIDLSLVSFNDVFPLERLRPSVTVIDLAGDEMGRVAVDLLLAQMQREVAVHPTLLRVKPRLLARGSVVPPA